ncbi:MazG nucleotide pyrophosphohydrolase domain-containing protein [Gynuella sunshinyii]|uniref:Putative pyrophosphatase n=1 Tax=Gynuella sunshinyii YC6258 TaxID=1445510 RepID=A0A0C5VLF6_9GAMM|nr:MazG nucleotide pyrophosphohydrolase domain-containing protein [Gynuella sunshinyii]AJQ95131.1 putative pyrophosphatase [Gynuella sunshinyii YC6258]
MPDLKIDPTLHDFQQYVTLMEKERGFSQQTATDKCLLLGEEVGELFKAVRRLNGLAVDPASEIFELEHELADVFIYLCSIANRYNISLEQAFRNKEKKNKQRNWTAKS